ncbi:hypothetical protein [Microbacterium sp. ProA8]|uniref:hypothetical protein n=1 Tax=Microbacterium chionoecetis TaxID=3153754 RepID=UPI003266CBD8
MSSTPPLLIDLAGVARLAGVQRPVASMWRARFSGTADPFPHAAHQKDGRPFFDAMSIAQWLVRTDHGNNPEAVADAAASAVPRGFDFADAEHVAAVDALLALHAVTGETVGGLDADALSRLAAVADPDDSCLAAEVSAAEPAWAEWADLLADAAYSPLAASRLLERRHASTKAAGGSAGPLTADAEALLLGLSVALMAGRDSTLVVAAGIASALAHELISALADSEVSLAEQPERRGIVRRLLLDGIALTLDHTSGLAPRLTVTRLPSAGALLASEMLRTLDELVLAMRDDDRALVLAPAGVLIGSIATTDALTRTDVLRSGRVRAIVRLPSGLVTSAAREALALWVLGREAGDVPLADRFTAVADLTEVTLTRAARADLASDVVAAMGSAHDVRAHAFRFTRLVRTTSLLAARGDLLGPGARAATARSSTRELPALLDQARASMPDDVPVASPTSAPGRPLDSASVDALLTDRHLRVLAGTRLAHDEYSPTGLVAVGAEDLDNPAKIGEHRVDPMVFAQRHPSARLTAPGDIIFRTSPTAKAWVDADGSKVVAHPARVLRIDASDPGGLVPELMALDIDRSPGGAGSWRRWRLRRVAPQQTAPLRAALADIATRRRALEHRVEALDAYADLLAAGVASGTVMLTDPAAAAASVPQ